MDLLSSANLPSINNTVLTATDKICHPINLSICFAALRNHQDEVIIDSLQTINLVLSIMPQPPIIVYGIKNCDSIKKTRTWLDNRNLLYQFHDYRVDGLEPALLQQFADKLGIDAILNQRSTSWRQLDDEQKLDLTPEKALQLMLANPTLIKRPIIAVDEHLFVGFNHEQLAAVL